MFAHRTYVFILREHNEKCGLDGFERHPLTPINVRQHDARRNSGEEVMKIPSDKSSGHQPKIYCGFAQKGIYGGFPPFAPIL